MNVAVRWLVAVLAGLVAALTVASPASAHGADVPAASDYRCVVTGLSAEVPGLTVRTVSAGTQLELVNHTGRAIEVLGYSGEPYLRVAPDGVYQNANSPATYLNQTLTGGPTPPASATASAPPAWQKLSGTPAVLWHDHRAHWMLPTKPPVVADDPGSPHRISSWSIPLRDGVRTFAVTGTLDWVPPPAPAVWWAGCLLLAGLVAGLGLLRARGALATAAGVAVAARGGGPAADPAEPGRRGGPRGRGRAADAVRRPAGRGGTHPATGVNRPAVAGRHRGCPGRGTPTGRVRRTSPAARRGSPGPRRRGAGTSRP